MSGHILELSQKVERKKVVYRNRYGLDITGELYFEKGTSLDQKHPALIIGAPYGGVPSTRLTILFLFMEAVRFDDQANLPHLLSYPRAASIPEFWIFPACT